MGAYGSGGSLQTVCGELVPGGVLVLLQAASMAAALSTVKKRSEAFILASLAIAADPALGSKFPASAHAA